ncbi:MAG: hypothetical protein ACYC9S_09680 [Leptospirales bacterium]
MRKTVMLFLSFFALASVAMFFAPKTASAYPGFARKYNFPCSFCHIQWPKLADTGHFFKDRGFMLSTTGKANGLDMMFQDPKNQNYFPIGFHMSMAYGGTAVNGVGNYSSAGATTAPGTGPATYNAGTNGGWANGASANTPWDIESGGLLNPWISFWVQPGYAGSNTIQIVKLWVRFNDLLNSTWLNIYAGKTSIDPPFSNQRNVYIGTSVPWTMYDFQPGTPEVAHNGGATNAGFTFVGAGLYTSGDMFQMANDVTSIRYFGYHINSGASCSTQKAFSINPCETRVSISFIPNSSLYGSNSGVSGGAGNTTVANNGFNYFMHVTQSFGGWGRTNGERIGAFALVGEAAALPTGSGYGGTNPNTVFNREGVDFMVNPIPNGGLNIFGAWEIAQDPTGMIAGNTAFSPSAIVGTTGAATSGAEYMTWLIQADWQPTFGGFFSQSGTNSNMISLIYNQLNMMQQPTFSGATVNLPGNYDNVTAITLSDRYWLWGSDRADISLFAQYQYMINYGVAGALSDFAYAAGGNIGNTGTKYFGNVEANNFAVGLDFAY